MWGIVVQLLYWCCKSNIFLLIIFFCFVFFSFCKKIIKYYQPRQLVVRLLWEMSVGIISLPPMTLQHSFGIPPYMLYILAEHQSTFRKFTRLHKFFKEKWYQQKICGFYITILKNFSSVSWWWRLEIIKDLRASHRML
jgi:hypothetical protein